MYVCHCSVRKQYYKMPVLVYPHVVPSMKDARYMWVQYVHVYVYAGTHMHIYVCVCMHAYVHAVEQMSFMYCTVALSFVVLGVAYSGEQFVRSGTKQINSCSMCNGQRWVLSPICAGGTVRFVGLHVWHQL